MKVTDGQFFVSEIFESVQGEGSNAGTFALFVRFQFCNLACTWCDTKFTWHAKPGCCTAYDEQRLLEIIAGARPKDIVFTGGEPALYRLDKLYVAGKKYHVETNGTIDPVQPVSIVLQAGIEVQRGAMDSAITDLYHWTVSPKLTNANQKTFPDAIKYWADKDNCTFKIIVRSVAEIDEVDQLKAKFGLNKNNIYIGLEGTTAQSQLQPALVDEIIRRGYHFSPRLHILLWGNTRGK